MAIILDKHTHENIIQRAESELALLAKEEAELHTKLEAIFAELETLSAKATHRAELLRTACQTREQAQQDLGQAQTHARLVEGMEAHADAALAAKEAEKRFKRIHKETSDIEARCQSEESTDTARRGTLTDEQQAHQARLGAMQMDKQHLHNAKKDAFAAIGELEHRDVLSAIEQADKRIEALERQLADERVARDAVVKAGLDRLADWPALRQPIRAEHAPYSDDVTRVTEGIMDYLDRLLKDGGQLPTTMNLGGRFGRWFHYLCIEEDHLNRLRGGNSVPLSQKRYELGEFLRQYREAKQS
jgi:hypothetical protein